MQKKKRAEEKRKIKKGDSDWVKIDKRTRWKRRERNERMGQDRRTDTKK